MAQIDSTTKERDRWRDEALALRRKVAELEFELADSEERFRFAAENSGWALYRLSYATMTYDYLSPGIQELTGYRAEEIDSTTFSEMVRKISMPGGEEVSKDRLVKLREIGRTGRLRADYLVRTKTGELKWLADRSMPWLDREGRIIGSIGVLTDVTDQKETEAELRESRRMYGLVANNAVEGIAIIQADRIIFANPGLANLTGVSPEELGESDFREFIHEDDREGVVGFYRRRLKGLESSPEKTIRVMVRGEGPRWVEIRPSRIDWAGEPAVLTFVIDVHERMEAQEALRRNEERLRQITEPFPLPILVTNGQGEIEYFNPKLTEILGYTIEDLPSVEEANRKFYPDPEYRSRVEAVLTGWAAQPPPQIHRVERRVSCKDGRVIDAVFNIALLETGGRLAVMEDVTREKEAERQRLKAEQLKTAIQTAAGACHELNQPLQTIIGQTDLLMMKTDSRSVQGKGLAVISAEAERMAELTAKLARITHYETQEYPGEVRIMDIEGSSK